MTSLVSKPISLTTADGLELPGRLSTGPKDLGIVIAHPHPLFGGSMDSPVVTRLFDRACSLDLTALRFNFRGAPGAGGVHDHGRGERLDLAAALDVVAERVHRIVLAGYSFGGDVALASGHEKAAGWFVVAPTLQLVPPTELEAPGDRRPKLLAIPEHDAFNPPGQARTATADWTNTRVEVVPEADHMLMPGLGHVSALFAGFLSDLD